MKKLRKALIIPLIVISIMLCGCNEISSTDVPVNFQTTAPTKDEITTIPSVTEADTTTTSVFDFEDIQSDMQGNSGTSESSEITTTPDTQPSTDTTTITTEPTTITTTETTTEPTTTTTTTTEETTTEPTTTEPETSEETTTQTSEEDIVVVVPPTNTYTPLNFSSQNGMWISYLDLYSIMQNKSESSFRASFGQMLDNSKGIGCNTVYVHCRAFGDAYYESDYYPYTKYCTGVIGVSNGYDPLAVMVEEAHSRGMSIHAWVNPMRIDTKKNIEAFPSSSVIKQWYDCGKVGTYIMHVSDTNYYWLNPAYEEVRALICNGVTEIISKYDVDGIHIDDYFYPTTDKSFDSAAFAQSGASDLSAWRIETISRMVSDMYTAVKKANPNVLFGISPQGNIDNNYSFMYADVRKWCSQSGYLDYIIPQVYFGFKNQWCPFEDTVKKWSDMVTADNVKIIYGLGIYNLGTNTEFTYDSRIFARQIEACMKLANYDGIALYRYDSCFNPSAALATQTNNEISQIKEVLS